MALNGIYPHDMSFTPLSHLRGLKQLSLHYWSLELSSIQSVFELCQVIHLDMSTVEVRDTYSTKQTDFLLHQLSNHHYRTVLLPEMRLHTPLLIALTQRLNSQTQTQEPSPLEHLRLASEYIPFEDLPCWFSLCTNLEVLDCRRLCFDVSSFVSLCTNASAAHLQLPRLLSFSGFDWDEPISDKLRSQLASACLAFLGVIPNVQHLHLLMLVDEQIGVEPILHRLHDLTHLVNLHLEHCRLDSHTLSALTMHPFSCLQFLTLWSVDAEVRDWMPVLQSLHLLSLNLMGVSLHSNLLLALGTHCHELVSLSLVYFPASSSSSSSSYHFLLSGNNACLFPSLVELRLQDVHNYQLPAEGSAELCRHLAYEVVPFFAQHAPALQFLFARLLDREAVLQWSSGRSADPETVQQAEHVISLAKQSFFRLCYLSIPPVFSNVDLRQQDQPTEASSTSSNASSSRVSTGSPLGRRQHAKPPPVIPRPLYDSRSVAEFKQEIAWKYYAYIEMTQ